MLLSEIRHALRSFGRQPLGTTLVLAMLCLGIAANVVVFSLVNGLFLRPLPFREPERLVYINEKAPRWNLDRTAVNFPDFDQWRKASRLFEGLALYDDVNFNLSDDQGAERIAGAGVTHDYLGVLGVAPILGRAFTAEEDRPNGPRVLLISEGLWRDRFGAERSVLGRTLRLNGVAYEIIGVLPRHAEFPFRTQLWVPLAGDPNQQGQSYSFDGVGRLKPGVSVEDAEKDLLRAHAPIWEARDKERVVSPFVRPLREVFVADLRTIAKAMFTAVALLLVVACANVAALMLARAIARRREMGIRLALGATRLRVMRQLFVENLLLAVLSALLGVTLGDWALTLLVTSVGDRLPSWATFALDSRTLLFSVLLTGAATLLFGWAPALHAVRGDLRGAMSDAVGGTTASPRGRRTLSGLVIAEFALCAVLLVGGGLLFKAFGQVQRVDPGFRPDGVLTFAVALPNAAYADGPARLAFWDRLLERLRAAPGVQAAGIVSCPPLGCHWGNFYRIEGRLPLKAGESDPVVLSRVASDGYFEAMGIRLKSGRGFDARDGRQEGVRTVIVNETFVRTFWPGVADAVGKRIAFNGDDQPWITVVGVVRDVKHYGLERPMRPGLYFPAPQLAARASGMTVAVRTGGDPEAFTTAARGIVRELDPSLPLFRVRTMRSALAESLRTRATYSWMLAVFAGLTLLLALGGSYGVTSYLVTQRTREIGIRMAMGADNARIVGAMLRGSLAAIGAGVALGVGVAVAAARLMNEILFGVPPYDPSVAATAVLTLLFAALAANWLPARRAARTDPAVSLRLGP